MAQRSKTWKVRDWGPLDRDRSHGVELVCTSCGREAEVPVSGMVIAQIGQGLVFDGDHCMPTEIQCRGCRRVMELC